MGLAGEYEVRGYDTRRNVLQLTFNFLAGNQEAEESKALIQNYQSRTERLRHTGRTYRNDGSGDSDIPKRWPNLERLRMHVSEQTR
jgi:hypothetical protein